MFARLLKFVLLDVFIVSLVLSTGCIARPLTSAFNTELSSSGTRSEVANLESQIDLLSADASSFNSTEDNTMQALAIHTTMENLHTAILDAVSYVQMNKGEFYPGMMPIFNELESSLPKFVDSMNNLSEKKSFFETAHVQDMYSYLRQDFNNLKAAVSEFMSTMYDMGVYEADFPPQMAAIANDVNTALSNAVQTYST